MAGLIGNLVDTATGGLIKNPFRARGDITYSGTITIKKAGFLFDVSNLVGSFIDSAFGALGRGIDIHLISSTHTDRGTGNGKLSKKGYLPPWNGIGKITPITGQQVTYDVEFAADKDFGIPGAFTVKNNHPHEFYLVRLELNVPGGKHVVFPCNSWVFPASNYKTDRIFFSNELYLPDDTPAGLVSARKTDLKALQGDGRGERVSADRIYDYDVYNDLGTDRQIVGGAQLPYPRRCRTGRRKEKGDYEVRTLLPVVQSFYLPADEMFSSNKNSDFIGGAAKAFLQSIVPTVASLFTGSFLSFRELDLLYDNGFDISKLATVPLQQLKDFGFESPFQLVNQVIGTSNNSSLLKFPRPQVVQADRKAWMSDEEFARQILCGPNPLMIERLKSFPPTSKLPNAAASVLTASHLSNQLEGKSVEQALSEKKLFVLDYHDTFLPFIERINSQKNVFMYASRTVLFLKPDGTLKPVAIELTTPSTQRVFTPPNTAGSDWLWELAKIHATSNDSVYHQLASHWLRTHCCIEPFILALHRQISNAHPINAFLNPHFKSTLNINSLARQILVNSGGIMEVCFSSGDFTMPLTSAIYKDWNLFNEGLPSDLLRRGIAVPDPSAKHGLKLLIEDYPYAVDGLEIWAAVEKWTEKYVNIVYKDDHTVAKDSELQAWWDEVINFGHADKRNESWWGKLDTKKRLVQTLTTIIWIVSAHHAAVNFSQYAYLGYMPNHPTRTHEPIPELGSREYQEMEKNKEAWFLKTASRKDEAVRVLLTLEILSTHAEEEAYLGQRPIQDWTADDKALKAFREFGQDLKEADDIVSAKNKDPSLKNRRGPVQVPYTLLLSTSEQGMTARGVPNSISI